MTSMNQNQSTLLMMSGGLDSAVLAHQLRSHGANVRAVFFHYGADLCQQQLRCTEFVCKKLGMQLHGIELAGIRDVLSSLNVDFAVMGDSDTSVQEDAPGTPSAMLLTTAIALYLGQFMNMGTIQTGIIRNQAERNPGMVESLNALPNALARINTTIPVARISMPFVSMDKTRVIKLGARLGVDFAQTFSCGQVGVSKHCGVCNACQERREAFSQAAILDPTVYAA